MKSLLIISAKGSSGRTTLTCLLARHLQCTCHWRVLVLDLAEPPRSSASKSSATSTPAS